MRVSKLAKDLLDRSKDGKGVVRLNSELEKRDKAVGSRKYIVALLLSLFVGTFGIDRFYMSLIGTGILKLVTAGGCGVWWLIDVILIATNQLKDGEGKYLQHSEVA